jgi:alginate O-acetyltransferase complex protein AlgI
MMQKVNASCLIMPFNSPEFIFLFLPLTLLFFWISGFFVSRQPHLPSDWPKLILLAASILFYSSWNPLYLPILLGSILFNYWIGTALYHKPLQSPASGWLLTAGIAANLLLLGYFKYTNFLISAFNLDFKLTNFALPLGISFFTFQQIAYLVDTYRNAKLQPANQFIDQPTFQQYASFVAFFPYLTAGPLLRYQEIGPQLAARPSESATQLNSQMLAVGITLFGIGLFKKLVLSESIAPYANQIFDVAATVPLTLLEAWVGALAFTLQLYFDFSGYSDMAIGVALMFGFKLPLNFSSPYKATSIIDFWRRWHITLSNFLRDYLYIPLGGSRKGEPRRYFNLLLTMLIGGLWHGAGWTFVIWGGLHGLYLCVNHGWNSVKRSLGDSLERSTSRNWSLMGWLLTFVTVVVSWVFFRAENIDTAIAMLQGMWGRNGLSLGEDLSGLFGFLPSVRFEGYMPHIDIKIEVLEDIDQPSSIQALKLTGMLLLLAWLMPNTQQWLARYYKPLYPDPDGAGYETLGYEASRGQRILAGSFQKLFQKVQWQPNLIWAIVMGLLTVAALLNLAKVSEFLYTEF